MTTPEIVSLHTPPSEPIILTPHHLPSEDGKTSTVYELFADEAILGTLKTKPHWKILEWQGDNIFEDPQAELLGKLHDILGKKGKTELITCGIVFQERRKTPQFTAVLAPKKDKHHMKEYEEMMEEPSRIVEIRYDTSAFQVIAHNPDRNGGKNITKLKTRADRPYTPTVLQWVVDHHAEKNTLPLINYPASAHALSQLR